MLTITYQWSEAENTHSLQLIHVPGTLHHPFTFGNGTGTLAVKLQDFFIATTPVTQALWTHVMHPEPNPSMRQGPGYPLENVSWESLHQPGGFLDRLNESDVLTHARSRSGRQSGAFRLPSETEWEYAARGGPHWREGFSYSGSHDVAAVAWYDRIHGDHTQPVAQKRSNQLGLYDMSGNIWEWCQDEFTTDLSQIPTDGSPFQGHGSHRVLRGGCFHNWAIHCTVHKRYAIEQDAQDGCIGVRLVFA